jgi:hypothetical protein
MWLSHPCSPLRPVLFLFGVRQRSLPLVLVAGSGFACIERRIYFLILYIEFWVCRGGGCIRWTLSLFFTSCLMYFTSFFKYFHVINEHCKTKKVSGFLYFTSACIKCCAAAVESCPYFTSVLLYFSGPSGLVMPALLCSMHIEQKPFPNYFSATTCWNSTKLYRNLQY